MKRVFKNSFFDKIFDASIDINKYTVTVNVNNILYLLRHSVIYHDFGCLDGSRR